VSGDILSPSYSTRYINKAVLRAVNNDVDHPSQEVHNSLEGKFES